MNSLTLVIFGATGNLYADKLARALYLLSLEESLFTDFKIIAFGRSDFTTQNFRLITKEHILKRGEADISKLDVFVSHIEYFKGDFASKDDFVALKNYLHSRIDSHIVFHLATASLLYPKIFENLKEMGLQNTGREARIIIEKPFGKNGPDSMYLENLLAESFKPEDIFHIDHYLAKETAHSVSEFKPEKDSVQKIKIIFHESNIVGSRGASYDAVGAFRDVGQNHMLELLALAIMDKPAQDIRASRLQALHELSITDSEKIVRAQYEGYRLEPGVNPQSETETFFRVFLRSKNPNFSNVLFELEGGKGLLDMHSEITTTTVAVEIYFKSGEKKELKIQPVPGTVYESYTRVYRDAITGDQTNFPSIQEIIAEWKITDELLEKWKSIPLAFYKKGTKAEDIR